MVTIIAPARNNKPAAIEGVSVTTPLFCEKTNCLVRHLRGYEPFELESLLDVPAARAFDLYAAYQNMQAELGQYPALLSFYGQAYRNMKPENFTKGQLEFAQHHLRILSALYGMLRPLDGVVIHRLGLKKEFQPEGGNLHEFWDDAIYKEVYKQGELVVNLASVEYAKLVVPYMQPGNKMLTCRFLVDKPGGPRGTVSTVRAARGLMAKFIVENEIDVPQQLKEFDLEGYEFVPGRSSEWEYVFVRRKVWQ